MFRELDNTLQLRLQFVDFVAAFDFMTEVAALAEAHSTILSGEMCITL